MSITYRQFMEGDEGIVDMDTVPPRMAMDYERRNKNVNEKHKLCKRCDGTGNEFMSMYRKCQDCDGTGRLR